MSAIPGDAYGQGIDAFLHLSTTSAGHVKGESSIPGHEDDIEIQGWSLGVDASSAQGTQARTRRAYTHLQLVKAVDCSSTALLNALRSNAAVEARLTMRKAGQGQHDYFKIELRDAGVVSVHLSSGGSGAVVENLALAFRRISFEYVPQRETGQRGGASMFDDEILTEGGS